MSVVWDKAPVAANEVTTTLAVTRGWALATVRTLLRRLVRKGAVSQQVDGKRYLYSPEISLEECVKIEGESIVDRLMGKPQSSFLIHMVEKMDLTQADIQELQRILREKEKEL